MIPMRGGVKLFTVITVPKTAGDQMPIVLTGTPYDAGKRSGITGVSYETVLKRGRFRAYVGVTRSGNQCLVLC
jgi:predicted acyl esterase